MFDPSSHPIIGKQALFNRSTHRQWQLYASHRQQLERLIVPSQPGQRICVLGAGNCNDLDLPWLVQTYREIHLVDIDADALHRGVQSQKVDSAPSITLHGGIDLTGVSDRLGAWEKSPPTAADIQAVLDISQRSIHSLARSIGQDFDVVLSPCVLSQLLTVLRDHLGEDHLSFDPLLAAIRARHLRLMLELLSVGGRGVLACDLFSSATVPGLSRMTPSELPALMEKRLSAGRVFSGLEPRSILSALRQNPALAPRAAALRQFDPWLWHMGIFKSYLVYAISFERTNYIREPADAALAPRGIILP